MHFVLLLSTETFNSHAPVTVLYINEIYRVVLVRKASEVDAVEVERIPPAWHQGLDLTWKSVEINC